MRKYIIAMMWMHYLIANNIMMQFADCRFYSTLKSNRYVILIETLRIWRYVATRDGRCGARLKLSDNYENSVIGKCIVDIHNGPCAVIMRNVNARMINGEHLLTVRSGRPPSPRTIAVSNKLLRMLRRVMHTFPTSGIASPGGQTLTNITIYV